MNETERPPRSFREKSAWISLLSLVIVFGIYFGNVAVVVARQQPTGDLIPLFFSLVVALVVAEIVLHIVIAVHSPKDARAPKDERDRLIDLSATRTAFAVLMTGAFLSIATIHLRAGAWLMGHCVLFSIVAAEVVKFARQIVLYRRDA